VEGNLLPKETAAKRDAGYYVRRFSTVEVNNTFYPMPSASVLESWAEQVPDSFRFVLSLGAGGGGGGILSTGGAGGFGASHGGSSGPSGDGGSPFGDAEVRS
jgi:hypothetical protein